MALQACAPIYKGNAAMIRYIMHMLFCRKPDMIRQREGRKYMVSCSRCGYTEELVRR
jgi:translation initiation factor 2 beta subunit (eIF-2beta)/eIF-5